MGICFHTKGWICLIFGLNTPNICWKILHTRLLSCFMAPVKREMTFLMSSFPKNLAKSAKSYGKQKSRCKFLTFEGKNSAKKKDLTGVTFWWMLTRRVQGVQAVAEAVSSVLDLFWGDYFSFIVALLVHLIVLQCQGNAYILSPKSSIYLVNLTVWLPYLCLNIVKRVGQLLPYKMDERGMLFDILLRKTRSQNVCFLRLITTLASVKIAVS